MNISRFFIFLIATFCKLKENGNRSISIIWYKNIGRESVLLQQKAQITILNNIHISLKRMSYYGKIRFGKAKKSIGV